MGPYSGVDVESVGGGFFFSQIEVIMGPMLYQLHVLLLFLNVGSYSLLNSSLLGFLLLLRICTETFL